MTIIMIKKISKLLIPTLAIICIAVVVILNQDPVKSFNSQIIEPFDFPAYIQHSSDSCIVKQQQNSARQHFRRLYEEILVEESIAVTDSSGSRPLLPSTEASECFTTIFGAYFEIFSNSAKTLFNKKSWSKYELNGIKQEATTLLKEFNRGCGNREKNTLINYVKYVNGAYSAWELLHNAKSCGSYDKYKEYSNAASQYSDYPYMNNDEFVDIVQKVRKQAQTSWKNTINKSIQDFCEKDPSSFATFEECREEGNTILRNTEIFYSTFSDTAFGNARNRITAKTVKIEEYFNIQ